VTLATHPEDSTGVAHILEHGVLEGSKNYPVKIFKNISGRSLNTFLNAMTSSDFTSYPFASRNRVDYFNLMDLYMDAVFYPQLKKQTFLQEGWRYEFAKSNDSSTPLEYKGVVFNEMKGAMSNPVRLFHEFQQRAIFPDLTYQYSSGGDPKHIPDLTYDQWVGFHKKFYHPSNSFFYTYGDIPLADLTAKIEDKVLSRFEPSKRADPIPLQPKFDAPKNVRYTYPMTKTEDPARKSFIGVLWKLIPSTEFYENLKLSLMDTILAGSTSALLNRNLLESGLGGGLAPVGFHTSYSESVFGAGVKDANEEDAEKIETIVFDTLNQVCRDGFEESEVHAAIHEMEFSSREITGDGGVPFGLSLAFRGLKIYMENGDFSQGLKIDQYLEKLRKEALEPDFFKGLIQKYLLDNTHRIRMVLAPNPGGMEQQEIDRRNILDSVSEKMSNDDVQEMINQARDLLSHQKDEGDLSCLPVIRLEDISSDPSTIPQDIEDENGTKIYKHPIPTNGINYTTLNFSQELTDQAPINAIQHLGILSELGAGGKDYIEMGRLLRERTGGVSIGAGSFRNIKTKKQYLNIDLSGRCLPRNQGAMIELMGDMATAPDLTNKNRLAELINMRKAYAVPMAASSGHQMALLASGRWFSPLRNMSHNVDGLGGIQRLLNVTPESLPSVTESINDLLNNSCTQENLKISLTGDSHLNDQLQKYTDQIKSRFQKTTGTPATWESIKVQGSPEPEAWVMSTDVSYAVRTIPVVHQEHPDSTAFSVLSSLMELPMYELIRAQGGAYGAFSLYDSQNALFSMMTYRDPHTAQSIEAFDKVVKNLAKGDFTDEKLLHAIINVISHLDRPTSPRGRGSIQFTRALKGVTEEDRRKQREGVINTTRDDIVRILETYLIDPAQSAIAIVTSDKTLENDETKSMNLVRKNIED